MNTRKQVYTANEIDSFNVLGCYFSCSSFFSGFYLPLHTHQNSLRILSVLDNGSVQR